MELRDVTTPPPALRPRFDGWAGTGKAEPQTRLVRNVSETFAPPVIEVGLDGGAEGMVAAGLITTPVRVSSTSTGRLLNTAARHRTTPMALDIPRRTFVASARPAGDESSVPRSESAGIS